MIRWLSVSMLILNLTGCEGLKPLMYNMTQCPITIIYSAVAIRNQSKVLDPGQALALFGVVTPPLDGVAITEASGTHRIYDEASLANLRPPHAGSDLWGYFPDGLRFLNTKPKISDSALFSKHSCESEISPGGLPTGLRN